MLKGIIRMQASKICSLASAVRTGGLELEFYAAWAAPGAWKALALGSLAGASKLECFLGTPDPKTPRRARMPSSLELGASQRSPHDRTERGYFRRLDIGYHMYHMESPLRVFDEFRRFSCKSSGRDSDAMFASGTEHGSRATFKERHAAGRSFLAHVGWLGGRA